MFAGSTLVLTTRIMEGDSDCLPVAWHGLSDLVAAGDVIYLADGAIRLRVKSTSPGRTW